MALKIIELLVDEALTGETRVEEIALVLQPAIETEFVYFKEQKFQQSYSDYPEGVKETAQKVIRYTEENGWGSCGTPVGKTRASQLAKGEPISIETIQRMFSYLSRHKKDLESSKSYDDGCGKLMYDAWGGEAAIGWAERKLRQVEEEMGYDVGSLSPWSQTSGTTEMCGCGGDMVEYEFEEPCWDGYIMVGMKEKDGKMVPNCVPETQLSAYELDVFGYKTKFFYICPGAQGTFKEIISVEPTEDSIGMIRSAAVVADKVFEIEAEVLKNKNATEQQLNTAKVLVEDFKDIIGEIEKIQGKKFDISYMDGHIQTISSYVGKQEMDIDPCGCGCWNDGTYPFPEDKLYFGNTLINGMPVYDSIEEAEAHANQIGCAGYHVHTIDGKEVYMPCETHPEEDDIDVEYYSEEEFEAAKLLKVLKDTDYEKFEAVVGAMRGASESEVKKRNHLRPTIYFKYERVLDGFPDRDFCVSIENRYFRRLEIDLLRDLNTEFGHNREPYSKWLYKGGPNCVHAWRKYIVQGKDIVDEGFAEGKAGTPPKSLPNNGYYSEETKKRSERAYAISQSQKMSRQASRTIIVDVDDTLLKGGSPIKKTIDYVNKKWDSHKIVIVSGRQDSSLSQTRRELERAGVKFDEIYLSDFPKGPNASRAFKEYKAKWLQERGDRIVEAIENDDSVRRDYRKLGIKSVSPMTLSKEKNLEFRVDGERKMIYSPAMKPGILIPRIDQATQERYFVTFKPETIERMAQRYLIDKRTGGGHMNYEHSDMKIDGVYLVESWIVEGPLDKAYALGYDEFQVPKGTWMVGFRVDNDEVWKMVKDGDIKGISIEGNFEYKFSSSQDDEYLLKEIINIINQIQ